MHCGGCLVVRTALLFISCETKLICVSACVCLCLYMGRCVFVKVLVFVCICVAVCVCEREYCCPLRCSQLSPVEIGDTLDGGRSYNGWMESARRLLVLQLDTC